MALDENRQLKDEIIALEGRLAGLIGIVSQLPETKKIDRTKAEREARMHISSPHGQRHAEKIIEDITR
jgi:hypothetical protein